LTPKMGVLCGPTPQCTPFFGVPFTKLRKS
jgi:hypothetical protein